MKRLLLRAATLALALTVFASFGRAEEALSATARDFVHPVLVRKAGCAIGRVVVAAPAGAEATLGGLTISLAGTTDLADLESLCIYDSGPEKLFSTKSLFAGPAPPAASVQFQGSRKLQAGDNVFWIACKLRDGARLGRRVQAECVEVQTSAGSLKPKLEGNRSGHRIGLALRQAGEQGVHTYRIPALATTPKGTLLCVYDVRRKSSRDLQGDVDVGLSRSTDGGQTWEPMQIVMDMGTYGGLPENQNGVGDPGIVVDQQTGEVFVFALWVHAKPGTHQWQGKGSEPGLEIGKTAQFLKIHSTDDGRTWSKPVNVTRQIKRPEWILFAPSPQQGIQLKNGALVLPVQGRDEKDKSFATVMVSRDHGRTWTVSTPAYYGGNECQAAELSDGSILLNIRNDKRKRRAVVVSADQGVTWRLHSTHETQIEPTCNGSLYRWVDRRDPTAQGLLLFANPQDERHRVRFTIQVSTDDGATWPLQQRLLLDEGRGFGYPSLSRVDDDRVGIVYEGSQSHLVFERISRDELLGVQRPPSKQRP